MIDWQPISTAPRDGSRVMLWMEPVYRREQPVVPDEPHAVFAAWVVWPDRDRAAGMNDGWSWYGSAVYIPTHWAINPQGPGFTNCDHEWIDARNAHVLSGELCLKCGAIRAGNTV